MTDTRDLYKLFRELESQHQANDTVGLHDSFDLELSEHFVIESGVVGLTEDGVIIQLDEEALEFLDFNGMLTESEERTESQLMNEGYRWKQEIADSIRRRILNQHHDAIDKFGPVRIVAAIEDIARDMDHVDEIGSSDVSGWTKQVIDDLESGYYDDMDTVGVNKKVAEAALIEGSSRGVADSIRHRILHSHQDVISKYGPVRIMAAIREKAERLDDLEEIGSSDISIWTKEVIDSLENGDYDYMDSVSVRRGVEEASPITSFSKNSDIFDKVVKSDYPFKVVYDGISGQFGEAARAKLQDIYDDVVLDNSGFHPDDDFEKIIDQVVARIKSDYGKSSSQTPSWYQSAMSKELHEIKKLALGHSEDLNEVDSFGGVDAFKNKLSKSNDPFEMIYGAISGDFGDEIRKEMQEMYDAVVNDSGYSLHPDDDFEKIIEVMVDQLVNDSADYKLDELSDIKKLAGQSDVDEGLGKALLGGAALIAAITGVNKMQADHMMKTEPQLVALAKMHQEAKKQGDEYKVKEIEDRIEKTMNHISITGRPVMGIDGKPINPREPMGEAEYQGRKVPLGKPMQGDVAKSKVYVKKPDGKVVKVNFGDKNMTIKKNNPERRKSFRARHRCENPGPRWKARYWSCRAW